MECISVGCLCIDNITLADGKTAFKAFGGNAAYSAAGMRLWSKDPVGIVARAGNDIPHEWIDHFVSAGIDVAGIRHLPSRHLMISKLDYDHCDERTDINISTADLLEKAKAELKGVIDVTDAKTAEDIFAPMPEDFPDSYKGASGITLNARKYTRQMAYIDWIEKYAKNAVTVLDVSPRYMIPELKHTLPDLFSRVTVVAPSLVEAKSLFGQDAGVEDCLKGLIRLGAKNAVVKLGSKGSCTMTSTDMTAIYVPAYPVADAKDPTGAGDSFCSGLTMGLVQTGDFKRAVLYGTVSASFVVSEFGADGTFKYGLDDAERRLREFEKYIAS